MQPHALGCIAALLSLQSGLLQGSQPHALSCIAALPSCNQQCCQARRACSCMQAHRTAGRSSESEDGRLIALVPVDGHIRADTTAFGTPSVSKQLARHACPMNASAIPQQCLSLTYPHEPNVRRFQAPHAAAGGLCQVAKLSPCSAC